MNSANGGNIIYKFVGDKTNLDKTIKSSESGLSKLGKVGKGVMAGVAAATVAATAAVVSLTKKSLEAYADFEQLQGGLVSMMKGNTDAINKVMETSRQAYKNLQMSQNDYLRSFESSYAIIQNGIGNNKNAVDYTNKSLQLTADLFNTFGGSTEQYATAINWALKGTFSYIDNLNLGIKGTQEGFVEAANKSGVLKKNISDVKELTNDEIIDVLQHYAEKTGAWGKSQQEASTTILGSINMVKAAYNDFLSGQGSIDNIIESAIAAGTNISNAIVKLLPRITEGIVKLIEGIVPLLPGLLNKLLPVLVNGVSKLLTGLIKVLPQILPILIKGTMDLIKGVMKVLPQLIRMIVTAILQNINPLINATIDILIYLSDALFENIDLIIDAAIQIIMALVNKLIDPDTMGKLALAAGKIVVALAFALVKAVPKILEAGYILVRKLIQAFESLPGMMVNIGKNIINGIWQGIVSKADKLARDLQNWAKGLANRVKKALKIGSPSKLFANEIGQWIPKGIAVGITANTDSVYQAMKDLGDVSNYGISPQLTGSMNNHYSPSVVVTNNIDVSTDPLGQTVKKIKTFSGGAKNDYNYGMGV